MTQEQIDAVNAVYEAHDPDKTIDDTPPDILSDIAAWVATQADPPQSVVNFMANKIAVKSKL